MRSYKSVNMRLDIEIDQKEGLISVTGPDWVIKNVPALRRRLFKVFTYNHEKSIFQAGINKESVNLLIKIGISREHKIKLQSLIRENIYRLDLNIDEEEHCIKVTGPKFVIENITSVRKRLFELFTFNEEEAIFQTEISKKAVDLLVSIGLTNQQEHQLKEALGQSDTGDVFNVGQDYGTVQKYSEGQTTNSKYSSFDSDKSCGKFIRSLKHPNYGVGKLLSKKSDCVEIEYFDSPMTADRKTVCVKERDTEKVRLSHQTRAYFLDPKSRSWQIGRIAGHIDEDCFIYLPNKQREKLSEQEVYVRWDREIEDPAEHLAAQLTETPFFS